MIKPLNEAHSIKAVALVVEFPAEVDEEGLQIVKDEAKRFRTKLNVRSVLRRMGIQFPLVDQHSALQDGVIGYRYSARKSDGTDLRWFEVANSRAVFCSNEYTDFNSFWAEATYFLDTACRAFGSSGIRPDKVTLEYRDEFHSEVVDWEPADLFNLESGFLSKRAILQGEYWHSHYGFFDRLDGRVSANSGKINHVEVADNFDDSRMSQVNITLTHSVELVDGDDWKVLVSSLRSVHKEQIVDILSKNMLETIGLETGS